MSKFIILTKIKRKFSRSPKSFVFDIKFLNILIISLICLVGVLHVVEISSMATKGFRIKEIEQKIEQFKKENEKLTLQVTELQSFDTIKEKLDSLDAGMVSVAKIEYLLPSNLAVKK